VLDSAAGCGKTVEKTEKCLSSASPPGRERARFKARDPERVNVLTSDTMSLSVGQKAPDFDVVSSSGKALKLSDFAGKKNVVLYFYPGDFTPVCTKETCGLRDMYADLESKDTEVIGVSVDSNESHEKFAAKYGVPFALVSDANRELAKTYGATSFLRDILGKTSRKTFVIDKKGQIAGIFEGELSASKHVDGVKEAIRKLT
jgi:thioredoxin-dependent peroxiredoxin